MTLRNVLRNEATKLRDSCAGNDEWRTVETNCGRFDIHILYDSNHGAFDVTAYPVHTDNGLFTTDTSVWFSLGQIES